MKWRTVLISLLSALLLWSVFKNKQVVLAGVLFDEVALMPKSFVDQAIARTLSFPNAKIWFNCNPESSNHWFYKEWIKQSREKSKHIHFLMEDNPILSDKEIQRAKRLYSGVFYDRYIKGLWVSAEGVIYKQYADNPTKFLITKEDLPHLQYINIGVDFGGNKSKHAFCATRIDHYFNELIVLQSKSRIASGTSVDFITNNEYKNLSNTTAFALKDYKGNIRQIPIDKAYKDVVDKSITLVQSDASNYNDAI